MTIETTEPFASRAIAGISRSGLLLVLGTFCADIAATSNRTAAMYFMNEVPSDRGRRPAFSLIEFHQGIGDRSTYRSHPHPPLRGDGMLPCRFRSVERQLNVPFNKLSFPQTKINHAPVTTDPTFFV